MLVLSRRTNESITLRIPPSPVEQEVKITAVRLPSVRSSVRLGFDADPRIKIVRTELADTERAA